MYSGGGAKGWSQQKEGPLPMGIPSLFLTATVVVVRGGCLGDADIARLRQGRGEAGAINLGCSHLPKNTSELQMGSSYCD